MRKILVIISCCTLGLFMISGCSNEEGPVTNAPKAVVRKSIPAKPVDEIEILHPVEGIDKNDQAVSEVKEPEDKNLKAGEDLEKEKKPNEEELKGVYIVQKGDSLSSISSSLDSYDDPLKWIHIYYLNKDDLGNMDINEKLPDVELEQGLRLKIHIPEDFDQYLKKRDGNFWVINVLSARTNKKIVPNAVKLIKNGYQPYITKIRIKGEDWMRLRIGFFREKKDAMEVGEKIKPVLNLSEIWAAKIENSELDDFGRY